MGQSCKFHHNDHCRQERGIDAVSKCNIALTLVRTARQTCCGQTYRQALHLGLHLGSIENSYQSLNANFICRFRCVPVNPLEVVAHRCLAFGVSPATRCATASFNVKLPGDMTHVHSKLPNHADQHEVDVAIVGGGPGGLATAAAVLSAFGDTLKVKVRLLMFFANNMGVTKTSAPDLAESMRKAPSTLVD